MKNRVLGLAVAAALLSPAMAMAHSDAPRRNVPPGGSPPVGGWAGSFRHRFTKPHLSREERDRKYKAQRRANRLRRKALQR